MAEIGDHPIAGKVQFEPRGPDKKTGWMDLIKGIWETVKHLRYTLRPGDLERLIEADLRKREAVAGQEEAEERIRKATAFMVENEAAEKIGSLLFG